MVDFLYATGYRQAIQKGLPLSEREECAAGFRLLMLLRYPDCEQLVSLCRQSPALIVHCARQYALDQGRKVTGRREWLWSQAAGAQEETGEDTIADPYDAIGTLLNRLAFQQQIAEAITALSPVNRSYLRQRFREQESYSEIAGAEGKKVNAVEQAVSRALKQIRLHLQQKRLQTADHVDICLSDSSLTSCKR